MTHLRKNSLMLATMVAAFAVAQADNATGQVVINSGADIPVETASGAAQAYYEAATGNVYFSLGTDLFIAGVANVDDLIIIENFLDPLIGGIEPSPFGTFLPPPFSPPLESGIFNLGAILPADPSITDIASFQASPFGAAQLQFSTGAIEGFNDFNVISATAIPEPGSLSILALAGLTAGTRRRR